MVKVLSPLSLVWTGPRRTSYAKAGYWILGAAWPQTESRLKGNDSLGTCHASKKGLEQVRDLGVFASLCFYNLHMAFNFR